MNLSIDKLIIPILPLFTIALSINRPFDTNVIYLFYIAAVFLDLFKNRGIINYAKQCRLLYACFIIGFFAIPIIAFKVQSLQSLAYVLLLIVFFRVCELIGKEWGNENDRSFLISCVLVTIIVDLHVILHIDEINNTTIMGVFYESGQGIQRVRASFGYLHPNTAAIILVSAIVMLYIMQTLIYKVRNKVIIVLCILFNFVALLCTGSRTGVISILCFFTLLIGFVVYSKLNKPYLRFILVSIVVIGVIALTMAIGLDMIAERSSGRDIFIKEGLGEMLNNGTLLFGEQVASITKAASSGITVSGTDNWYYMTVIRFGIFGMLMFFIPFIVLSVDVTKRAIKGKIPKYIPAAILMLCIYSIGENVLFNQGVMVSCLVMSLFFESMHYQRNK